MYRLGHTGIALLVLAPLSYELLEAHKPILALITGLGILGVERLPDYDFKLPFLSHRGVSHSLFAAVTIGGFLALCGWFVGMEAVTVLTSVLGVTTEVVTTVATWLDSLAPPETTGNIVAWIIGLLTDVAAILDWIASQLQTFDRQTIAGVGFVIGAGGILVHLLGDVLTVTGIRPFLPFSDWNLSVSSLNANSSLANTGLFAVGVLAVAVVLATTVAGIGFAVAPAQLSPIGVASAQDASVSAHNGSVTINETASNRSRIILEGVTLPKHGYIVAQTGNLSATKVVGHTQYVRNGSYEDVVLDLNETVAKGTSVVVTIHNDTNGNETWDGIQTDVAYAVNGTAIHDSIRFTANQTSDEIQNTSNATAMVELDSSNNTTVSTVVVSKIRLPEGGFVAVHGVAYARRGVLQDSAITVSHYFSPGVYRNVTIPVKRGVPGLISNYTQLSYTRPNLSVIVYQDTNDNQQYDFVTSFGSNDTPYQTSDGEPVVDTEKVVLEANVQQVNQRTQSKPVRIRFENQQVDHVDGHPVLTIQNATLPKGGFIVVHDARYLGPTRDALNSAIGISGYLAPGVHRNVTVRLINGSVTETQTLVAVAYLDTDGDHRYDFITTSGEDDYAYIERQNGSTVIVNDTATVRVPQSQLPTPTPSSPTPTTSDTSTATGEAKSESGGGFLAGLPLLLIVSLGAAFVAGILLLLVGRRDNRR